MVSNIFLLFTSCYNISFLSHVSGKQSYFLFSFLLQYLQDLSQDAWGKEKRLW